MTPAAPDETGRGLDEPADEATVIARGFGGDAALYREFLQACAAQFPHDVAAGDAACASGDAQALCYLTHSLKSVLRSLGRTALGDRMGAAEALAAQGDLAGAAAAWAQARSAVLRLVAQS